MQYIKRNGKRQQKTRERRKDENRMVWLMVVQTRHIVFCPQNDHTLTLRGYSCRLSSTKHDLDHLKDFTPGCSEDVRHHQSVRFRVILSKSYAFLKVFFLTSPTTLSNSSTGEVNLFKSFFDASIFNQGTSYMSQHADTQLSHCVLWNNWIQDVELHTVFTCSLVLWLDVEVVCITQQSFVSPCFSPYQKPTSPATPAAFI